MYKFLVVADSLTIKDSLVCLFEDRYRLGEFNCKKKYGKSGARGIYLEVSDEIYEKICEIKKKYNTSTNAIFSNLIEDYLEFKKVTNPSLLEESTIYAGIEMKKIKRATSKSKLEYCNFEYKDKEKALLKEVKLTEYDVDKIEEIKLILSESKYYPIAKDLYIMHINNYSPDDLGEVYHKSNRTFQMILKEVGLNRNKWEAQAIATTKRNYKEIQLKGRATMIKNQTSIHGSFQEQYIRDLVNCSLPIAFPNSEIIVGLNNKSILENGKEIDVPIIIFHNDKIIKLAIEYDGSFWHSNEKRDNDKEILITEKGYTLFRIAPKPQATKKQIKETIDEVIENIIKFIKEQTNN